MIEALSWPWTAGVQVLGASAKEVSSCLIWLDWRSVVLYREFCRKQSATSNATYKRVGLVPSCVCTGSTRSQTLSKNRFALTSIIREQRNLRRHPKCALDFLSFKLTGTRKISENSRAT